MDESMEIIDGHMHLWSSATHPWVKTGGRPVGEFVPTYLVDEYKADVAGYHVSKSVHVECDWPGDDPVKETIWLEKLADEGAIPHAIVGHCDLSSANVADVLQGHAHSTRVRGVRHSLNFHPDYPQYSEASHDRFLTNVDWIEGFGLLDKYQMSFDLQILPHQMKRAADVIKQYPNTMVMVEHCGLPCARDDHTMKLWREGLSELARHPNVFCKASMFITDPKWNQESVDMVVKPLFQIFGPDRTIFASNFPVDKMNVTFCQLIDTLRVILQPFSREEQMKFFAGNARRFYRL